MTTLADHEALATRVCFDAAIPEDALRALAGSGGALAEERWRVYREMIRARLRKVVRAALPRAVEALGESRLEAYFAAWLAEAPPDTRFFREVPTGFVRHAEPSLDADEAQPWLGDLARYELARWRVLAAPDAEGEALPLAFELAPKLTPALELLDVRWAVHKRTPSPRAGGPTAETTNRPRGLGVPSAEPRPEATATSSETAPALETGPASPRPHATSLLIYRRARATEAHAPPRFDAVTLELNPLARDLLRAWRDEGDAPLAARVQAVAAARDTAIDEAFIDGLGTLLEDLLSRGVVLGSRR